jgi:glycine/D-amino acid oxidase-like deaminating enzyme
VGAGAVGCSIAYQLARRGAAVTLVDKAEPGAGASSANFGLIWSHTKEPAAYMDLHLRSIELWPRLVAELGEDVDLRLGGGAIDLCFTADDYKARAALIERQRRSPRFEGRLLSADEVVRLQPGVSRAIAGASWSPHDGDCNWDKWMRTLIRGCRRAGVTILTNTEVTGLDRDSAARIAGISTNQGPIATRIVVNAAGAAAARIAAMVGLTLGLSAQRGQILITEPAPITCPVPMALIRQDAYGRYYLSTFHDEEGPNTPSEDVVQRVIERAGEIVPALRGVPIARRAVGLYPKPADDLPYLGPIASVPGLYVAAGHSGIGLSPIHGRNISDLVLDGSTDVPIRDYDPMRHARARPDPDHRSGTGRPPR